jgi:hypothetical protein
LLAFLGDDERALEFYREGKAPNLILKAPEPKCSRRRRREEMTFRLECVKQAFKDTLWSLSLEDLQASQSIWAIAFSEDISIAVIKADDVIGIRII